jgi:hypothetical protein
MPISEMQARVFCAVLKGEASLPDKEGMLKDIREKMDEMHATFVASRRHTIQVCECLNINCFGNDEK